MSTSFRDRVLLWTDVETGGLVPNTEGPEFLLEVAIIPTDATGREVLADPVEYVVHFPKSTVEQIKAEVDPVVLEMHKETGLWDRVADPDLGVGYEELDELLLEYVSRIAPAPRSARLAGSSIRLDLNFLEVFTPQFYSHIHYRSVDVTSLVFLAETYGIQIDDGGGDSEHNAMSDIARSLNTYRRFVRKSGLSGRLEAR